MQSSDVAYNLHRGDYSVRRGGRVVEYRDRLTVTDVKFVVQQAGWRRAVLEGRRNVHAFVRGNVLDETTPPYLGGALVRYDIESGLWLTGSTPLAGAAVVRLAPGPLVTAKGLQEFYQE